MIAVIFEVEPKAQYSGTYFDIAAELRPLVEKIDGFISIERFESRALPGKFLSLSFWRDEESIRQWREHEQHRHAQERGKTELFAGYRLRVAHVVRDYGSGGSEQSGAHAP
jgi:heme-degrading monooxygenase HmoA